MADSSQDGSIVALDVGDKRIGVAAASLLTRLARPVTTVTQGPDIHRQLALLLKQQQAAGVVIGLPRSLNGDDTEQTRTVRAFVDRLESEIDIPVYWTDEALTSQKAEDELKGRRRSYEKSEIDSLAACYILDDFLANFPKGAA